MTSSDEALVSVLVPSYKAGVYLAHLVKSVLDQTHTRWELLILDDGSGDLKHPEVQALLGDPRIRCYAWTPNRGVSKATRFLMEQVQGEFWCYPGADDVLRPQFIEKRLQALRDHCDVSVVFGKGGQIDAGGKETWFHVGKNLFDQMKPLEGSVLDAERMLPLLLGGNIINTPSIMARSRATLSILTRYHMDWRYCQDWFYWLLLAGNGLSFYYDGEVLHDYRFHEQSLTNSPESWAWRNVEPALVLLVGMALAATTGEVGIKHYRQCRIELYGNWLVRSAKFRSHTYWSKWSALAGLAQIRPSELPSVVRASIQVFQKRRKARRAARVLHGLPSRYFADPIFD